MGRVQGKVAFITGAARGQGRSHAVRLAEEGASIIAVDSCQGSMDTLLYDLPTEDDLKETCNQVEAVGGRIVATKADVRDRKGLRDAFEAGYAEFGRVDIVLGNAGIMPALGEVSDTDEAFDDAIAVMLTGVYNTLRVATPKLVEQGQGGSIVLTSSTAGLKGQTTGTAGCDGYVAAKHGVVGLMRAYATTYAKHNIRVNTVHPCGCATPMIENVAFAQYAQENPETVSTWQTMLPVPQVQPMDISNAILWLCSDEARYVTGVTLPVDAGAVAR
ncbi:mycofactocin-coupled SDR family oxidoreductase [Mycolicibacterium thermoresistibile]|uniref:Oxidoreductase n=2 Tax=Mycolicibacterium thermoresistibile TaxID=1797 RepID=G7CH38_MYCT3|nr:mycofactocin-coupled SDR family oxidoreductase [Mycolicibacterium thermoresistibile]EHI12148.1 oxidoreductase [Mycolicibacterium thermoresistibile ATCC 19527]MCV7191137.1 mycofactocin-coupled SDR family oxidoreductase [Mycolicibacterium thermoresistibile]GAT15515.1 oxidoreductase [Mycolicibacterium thermoresistibile]SNW16934.1 oxidoreductase, SDR family [Mycolicibacterium thermoresistibile]